MHTVYIFTYLLIITFLCQNVFICPLNAILIWIICALNFYNLFHNVDLYFCSSVGNTKPTSFCSGLGGACIYIASDITIQKYFLKKRSLANGIAVAASGIGVFTWPLLARCIIDHYGWNGACLILGK